MISVDRIKKVMKKIDAFGSLINQKIMHFQCLSGNAIKIFAASCMFVDHFSKTVLSWYSGHIWFPLYLSEEMSEQSWFYLDNLIRFTLQKIGAMAFPLFCFLLCEGFYYTKNRKRYVGLIAFFALVSELPFDLAFFSELSLYDNTYPFYWNYQNVFFTLFLSVLSLWWIEKTREWPNIKIRLIIQIIFVAIMSGISYLIHSDYNVYGVVLTTGLYYCRKNRLYQILAFLLLYMILQNEQPGFWILITCFIMALYNGKRGKHLPKLFFYFFYPVHIAALYLIIMIFEKI